MRRALFLIIPFNYVTINAEQSRLESYSRRSLTHRWRFQADRTPFQGIYASIVTNTASFIDLFHWSS